MQEIWIANWQTQIMMETHMLLMHKKQNKTK